MKKNTKIAFIVLTVIIVALFSYYYFNKPKINSKPAGSPISATTITPTEASLINYQTYTNAYFGFSVEYPPDYDLTNLPENQGMSLLSKDATIKIIISATRNSFNDSLETLIKNSAEDQNNNSPDFVSLSQKTDFLDGLSAQTSLWQYTDVSQKPQGAVQEMRADALQQSNFFNLRAIYTKDSADRAQKLFNQIKTSFLFLN